MAQNGVTTENIGNHVSVAKEVVVNGDNGTGLQSFGALAQQLSGTGAVANRLNVLDGRAFTDTVIHNSVAAGLAATAIGGEFKVKTDNPGLVAYYVYQNVAGSGVLISEVPAGTALGTKQPIGTATIAAATTTNIGALDASDVVVEGVADIASLGNAMPGTRKVLRCAATPTFVNGPSLEVGGADLTMSAGETLEVIASGSAEATVWHMVAPSRQQIGLGSVENIAPADLPVSKAQQVAISALAERVSTQEAAYSTIDIARVVGTASPVSGSVAASATTYLFTGRPAVAGYIESISIFAPAQTAKLKVYRASIPGATDFAMAYEASLELAAGLNTFSASSGNLPEYQLREGDVLGIYVPSGIHYTTAVPGSTGYTAAAGDKTDGIPLNGIGGVTTTRIEANITIMGASNAVIPIAANIEEGFGRTFSLGVGSPAIPASLQYMSVGRHYAFDYVFKAPTRLEGFTLASAQAGVGKIVVLEPYIGGYRVRRSVHAQFAAGLTNLLAGVDFPADVVIPIGGLLAFELGTTNSVYLDVFDAIARSRFFYGDPADGVFPSYNWPSGLENLSGVSYLSGANQIRADLREITDPAKLREAPRYIAEERFTAANGPVTMLGDTWTKGIGVMSSTTTGISNGLEWIGGFPHLTDFTCRWRFAFTDAASAVYFYKRPETGAQGSIVSLSLASGDIVIYNGLSAAGALGAVNTSRATTLTLVEDREYLAEFGKTYRDWYITITDTVTGASDTVSWDGDASSAAGLAYGVPGIAASAGTIDVYEFRAWSARKSPQVLLFGDSITEGTGATTIADSWAYKVCEAANGVASPRGGDAAAAIVKRALFEINAYPAVRYVVFLMGTNDTNMTIWQRAVDNVASLCQTMGILPVFGTLPPEAADTNPVSVQNPYLRANYRVIDFASALTVNGDGETRDASKFADALHPNDAGHEAMYQRARLDLPEIFD